jgi:hypothetical protein
MSGDREWLSLSDITRSSSDIAREHAEADAACGRKWCCACAACRATRASMPKLTAKLNALTGANKGERS